MKYSTIIRILLMVSLLTIPTNVVTAGVSIAPKNEPISISFADLGYPDEDLLSPFDSTRVLFSTPPNWNLVNEGELELNFDVVLSGSDIGKIVEDKRSYGGYLTIRFNREIIDTIFLDNQELVASYTRTIQIPQWALQPVRNDGRHELEISLNASFSCLYDIRTLILIKSTSNLDLQYEISPPELDLSRLPAPFYIRSSLEPEKTLFVVPDEPDAGELQAALNAIASFGSISGAEFEYGLVSSGQLSNEDVSTMNLVFIGTPDRFEMLSAVQFSLPVSGGEFVDMLPSAVDDGIIQIAPSPWNINKVVLLLSGNTSDAVNKASQAIGVGNLFVFDDPTLVYIDDIQSLVDSIPVVEDYSFADLGYLTKTIDGIGVNGVEYLFRVSKQQVSTSDAYLELEFYHSGLMEYQSSSFSVFLNGELMSSNAFDDESVNLTSTTINIPTGLLKFGTNRLEIKARMLPNLSCDATGFSDPWFTISDQSRLHIPVSQAENASGPGYRDFKFYPDLLYTESDFGDLAFILPVNDTVTLNVAAELAYVLGGDADTEFTNFAVAYADDVPETVRNEFSMIVIGKASQLPFLAEFNDELPAPFDLTTDTASEGEMQIVYRIPPGVNVGYLEMLTSPYNDQKTIVVVSGNGGAGVEKAGRTLIEGDLRTQLSGQFAVTNGVQVVSSSGVSEFSIVGDLLPEAEAIVTTPLSDSETVPVGFERPSWLPGVLVGSIVLIMLIFGGVVFSPFVKRRASDLDIEEEVEVN